VNTAAPPPILVDLGGQLVLEHARARGEHLVGDRVVKHRAQRPVDVPDGPRCEQLGGRYARAVLAQVAELGRARELLAERANLPRSQRAELDIAQRRQHVELEAAAVVGGGGGIATGEP
jgi:hypothetical protein